MIRIRDCLAALALLGLTSAALAAEIEWDAVDQAVGRKGAEPSPGVHKYAFPRGDLQVSVDGVPIRPALALGGWAAFTSAPGGAMLMGDLVLTDTEVGPVMERLVAEGLEVSAVHNHLLRMSVPVIYMHIGGHGDPVRLAQGLRSAIALSHIPAPSPPHATAAAPLDLDTAALDRTLKYKGMVNGGVYQFSIARAETISHHGTPVPPSMGTAIPINFQPTGSGRAAITGDFVLLGREVDAVVKTLRSNGIEVTALHSHMVDDDPHLYFLHFWANDDAPRLAQALRAALDRVNVKPAS